MDVFPLTPLPLKVNYRFSIFVIISVSAGLPALVWSVYELIELRKNGQRISVFIILLLLTDFTEIFLTPYILIKYYLNELAWSMAWTCRVFWSLWWSSRVYGLLLNQLVVLEGLLSVRCPLSTAAVFSSPCFRIFYIILFLLLTISKIFFPLSNNVGLFLVFLFIVPVITLVISCRVSYSAERHSHASRKSDQHIWVIFIITLLVFYLPFILVLFAVFFRLSSLDWGNIYDIIHFPLLLMSVRLISDPLLCVLVCRQNLRLQT